MSQVPCHRAVLEHPVCFSLQKWIDFRQLKGIVCFTFTGNAIQRPRLLAAGWLAIYREGEQVYQVIAQLCLNFPSLSKHHYGTMVMTWWLAWGSTMLLLTLRKHFLIHDYCSRWTMVVYWYFFLFLIWNPKNNYFSCVISVAINLKWQCFEWKLYQVPVTK